MKKIYLIAAITLLVVGSIFSVLIYFLGPLIPYKVPPGTWAFTSYLILSCSSIGFGILILLSVLFHKKEKSKIQKEENEWEHRLTTSAGRP